MFTIKKNGYIKHEHHAAIKIVALHTKAHKGHQNFLLA